MVTEKPSDAPLEKTFSDHFVAMVKSVFALPFIAIRRFFGGLWGIHSWIVCRALDAFDFLKSKPAISPFLIAFASFTFAIINPFNADDFDDTNASAAINATFAPFYNAEYAKTAILKPVTQLQSKITSFIKQNSRVDADKAASIEEAATLAIDNQAEEKHLTAQDQILLVLFQESSLKSAGNPFWPPSYQYQQAVLEAIARKKPKAIFLDFSYQNAHPPAEAPNAPDLSGINVFENLENLPDNFTFEKNDDLINYADALSNIRNGSFDEKNIAPIPIFTGPVSKTPRLAELQKSMEFGMVSLNIKIDDTIQYPLTENGKKTPAIALYKEWCDTQPATMPKRQNQLCVQLESSQRDDLQSSQPLSIYWGFGARNIESELGDKEIGGKSVTACARENFSGPFSMMLNILYQDLFHGIIKNPRQFNCGYHDFILAQELLGSSNPTELDQLYKDRLATLIEGKIVLVGANIDWLSDKFKTPFGQQPGVAIHAMALDNLITYGADYQRIPGPGIGSADVADLFSYAMMFIALLVMVLIQDALGSGPQRINDINRRYAIYTAIIATTTIVTFWVGAFIMHWPPVDLFEIIITLLLATAILEILTPREII